MKKMDVYWKTTIHRSIEPRSHLFIHRTMVKREVISTSFQTNTYCRYSIKFYIFSAYRIIQSKLIVCELQLNCDTIPNTLLIYSAYIAPTLRGTVYWFIRYYDFVSIQISKVKFIAQEKKILRKTKLHIS